MDKPSGNKVNYGANRKQSYIIPKRGIIQRYPLMYISACTLLGLVTFFSRPLYDAFFREQYNEFTTPEQRKKLILDAWKI